MCISYFYFIFACRIIYFPFVPSIMGDYNVEFWRFAIHDDFWLDIFVGENSALIQQRICS